MEPQPLAPPAAAEEAIPETGELVVQNGRLRGTRRALGRSLTLIGRDPSCEFHLNVEGVHPLHCAIARTPAGLHLRDLGGPAGTLVNGRPVRETLLKHGDLLAVGPFQFRVELSSAEESAEPVTTAALRAERDALRVQAAAVAAQQAALAEEESRLRRRRKALERQKEQLAGHLDERRKELVALREQARRDRDALKAEIDAARKQQQDVRAALDRERQTVQEELARAGKERRRLVELRRRLKKRWRQHCQAHEADLKRREQELGAGRAKLAQEADALRRECVRMTQDRLRFNGEVELGRRKLQDEWQQLGLAQQQWEACLNQEQAERAVRLRELERRTAEAAAAEHALAQRQQQAEHLHLRLRKESEGLEARIRNQRLKLVEQEKQVQRAPAAGLSPASADTAELAPVVRRPDPDVPKVLARLAGDLGDQRRRLLEQWQSLLETHDRWLPERDALFAEVEAAGRELALRERRLDAREQALAGAEADLRRRQQELFEVRCALEAWQARLTARETFLDNERVMLLADVRAREEHAEARAHRLEELNQRRARRRAREVEELRLVRDRHEQMRRDYVRLWQECQDRRAELIREHRDLAARSLALEQFRQELLRHTADTPGADKRLARLHRRNLARIESEERDLRRERADLKAETKRLDRHAGRLAEAEEALDARHEAWARRVVEWEEQQAAAADREQHRRREVQHWQLVHEQDERQLRELREEVERIARLLLEEAEMAAPPVSQAA